MPIFESSLKNVAQAIKTAGKRKAFSTLRYVDAQILLKGTTRIQCDCSLVIGKANRSYHSSVLKHPKTYLQLKRFMGSLNHRTKFIPKLATETAQLRQLL